MYLTCVADASKLTAYGAAAYLQNNSESALVMAKTRVNPIKEMTLPRLELMAAVIATRIAKYVKSTLTKKYKSTKLLFGVTARLFYIG